MSGYKLVDLFCGVGGIRIGFEQTGDVDVVFSSEIDKFACQTYQANFGVCPEGDITKISTEDIPDHDILVGGFPCQAFSFAGAKLGFNDTRGTLFFDIARILQAKRPKAILLENVKGLLTHDKGRTFKVILNTLESLGYAVWYKVVSATDFNTPQKRERLFIVGFDTTQVAVDNKNSLQYFDVKSLGRFEFPKAVPFTTCVGDILETSETVRKYTISDRTWEHAQTRKVIQVQKGNGFSVYNVYTPDSPYTATLLATYYKGRGDILIDQTELGLNPRRLSPRECARLQGFPDTFKIPVSDTQAYKQFGNSVAVPVIKAIAQEMIKILKDFAV